MRVPSRSKHEQSNLPCSTLTGRTQQITNFRHCFLGMPIIFGPCHERMHRGYVPLSGNSEVDFERALQTHTYHTGSPTDELRKLRNVLDDRDWLHN